MGNILINAMSFVITIFLAYFLKRKGLFKQEDSQTFTKVLMNVTLPSVLLIGMNGTEINLEALVLIAAGLGLNIIVLLLTFVMGKKNRLLRMYTASSFGVGGFTIPFLQMFLPGAVALAAVFDIGNGLMNAGFTPVMVDEMNGITNERFSLWNVIKKLLSAPVFVVCLFMLILSSFGLSLPAFTLTPFRFFATANSFVAMFTIGLFLRLDMAKEAWLVVAKLLWTRYSLTIVLSLAVYFFVPISLLMRQTFVLILLSPMGNLNMINAVRSGSDEGMTGLAGSCQMLISLALMVGATILML